MRKPELGLIEENCKMCQRSKTGICKTHLRLVIERSKDLLLLCKDCPVKKCSFRDKYDGVCAFELTDTVDWDKKAEVNKMFHRTLELQRRMALRFGRLAHQTGDKQDFQTYDRLIRGFNESANQYLKFKGWMGEVPKLSKRKEKALVELKRVFQLPEEEGGRTQNAELRIEKRQVLS